MIPPVWDIHSERPRAPFVEHCSFLHTQSTTLRASSSAALNVQCAAIPQGNEVDTQRITICKNRKQMIQNDPWQPSLNPCGWLVSESEHLSLQPKWV